MQLSENAKQQTLLWNDHFESESKSATYCSPLWGSTIKGPQPSSLCFWLFYIQSEANVPSNLFIWPNLPLLLFWPFICLVKAAHFLRFAMHNVPWVLIMAGLLCTLLLQGSLRPRWLLSSTLPEKLPCHFLSPNWPFAHYLLSSIDNQDANGLIYHQTVINYNLNRLVVSWRHKFGLYTNYMLLGLMTITSIATILSDGMR